MKRILLITTVLNSLSLSNASNVSEGKLPIDTSNINVQRHNYTINDLPDEVLVRIFQQPELDSKDLDALALTSKRFNRVVNDPCVRERSFKLNTLISKRSEPIFRPIQELYNPELYNHSYNHHEAEKARLQAKTLSSMDYLRKTSIMHAYIKDHYKGNSELDRLVGVIKNRNSGEGVAPINVFKIDIHKVYYNNGTRIDDDFFGKLTFLQPTHIICHAQQLNFILEKINSNEEIAAKYRDVIFSVLNEVFDKNDNIILPQDLSKPNQMIYMLASKSTKKLLLGENRWVAYNLINGFISKHIPQANTVSYFSSSIIKAITQNHRKINEKHFKVIGEFLDYFYADTQNGNDLLYKYRTIDSLFSLSDVRIESLKNNLLNVKIKDDKSALARAIKILSKLNDSYVVKIVEFINKPILRNIREEKLANLINIFSKISYNKTSVILGALEGLQLESNSYKFDIIDISSNVDQPEKMRNIVEIVNQLGGRDYSKKSNIEALIQLPLENLSVEDAKWAIDLYKKLEPKKKMVKFDYLTKILESGVIDNDINIDDFIKNLNKYRKIYQGISIAHKYSYRGQSYIQIDNLIFYIACERDNGYQILDIMAKLKGEYEGSVAECNQLRHIQCIYNTIKAHKGGIEYFSDEKIKKLNIIIKDLGIGANELPSLIKAPEGNLSDDSLEKIKAFASQLDVNNDYHTKTKAIEKLLTIPVEKLNDKYIELIKSQ